jgi:thiamine-phosphate pyrophosphorylase
VSLRRPAICVITRARGAAGSAEREALVVRLAAAAEAGATIIQVRERQLDDRELLRFVREVADAVRPFGSLVIVNERTDVALAAGAGGVHLKSSGPSAGEVRRIVPGGFVVGRSIHSAAEAVDVQSSGGCDYLVFGTVFPSPSKPADHPVAGIAALTATCNAVSLPVIAIGGVTIERARHVAAAGAAGVAAISLFSNASDVGATVRALVDALTLPRTGD